MMLYKTPVQVLLDYISWKYHLGILVLFLFSVLEADTPC